MAEYPGRFILFILLISLQHFAAAHEGNNHNHINELNTNFNLLQICVNDREGFSEKLGGGAYTYPSLREDIGQAMISRASTGKMYFEFLTAEIPANYKDDIVNFFYLSDIDLNLREPYDIYVNGKFLLTFQANENGELSILKNTGDAHAAYYLMQRDLNGDGIGAFRLTVPTGLIVKGEKAKVKVQGHARGSNSWFMIFEATDVIDRLKVSTANECAFKIDQYGEELMIKAPIHFAGKSVTLETDGQKHNRNFEKDHEFAKAKIVAKPPKKSLKLYYNGEVFEMNYPEGDGTLLHTDILGMYYYHFKSGNSNDWSASIIKVYRPDFFTAYQNFFDRKYEEGKVAILNSSHQDIAWVDRPEVCKILRDTLLLTPILNDAFVRNDYGFDIEDGLMLREYLERHPDSKEKLSELLNRKLVSVGASYNCPYEDMYDAEDQVRQLYLGKRWVKSTFGGYDSKVYWNVDVPGKTLQYPQILKKAGVDYMVISRHGKGMFYWQSPDGSAVFTYSPGHYGNDIIHLSKDIGNKVKYGVEQVVYWDRYYNNSVNHTALLSDQDMLPAIDYSDFIEVWNDVESIKGERGNEIPVHFPEMELMTVDEFLPLARQYATVDTVHGERPNVWIYIHGPSHHEAVSYSREASKLIPAAEKFLSIAYKLDPVKMPYPTAMIDKAWQAKIYPDHGWGGHDGDITDHLFKEKYLESKNLGTELLNKGTNFIASRIKTQENKGIPVVLFNSLSWDRSDPVEVTLNFEMGTAKSLKVKNVDGIEINAQLKNVTKYVDGSIKEAKIVFIATVPSIGYSTYYIEPLENVKNGNSSQAKSYASYYENDFYKIDFALGGIKRIFDKELKRDLLNTDSYKGGEVFTLQSVGNGAGEFGDVQQPTLTDFDQVSLRKQPWSLVDSGPVYSIYRIRQEIRHSIVEQDVIFFHALKRINFETRLLNWSGEMYREFRTAFPLNMENAEISYEVPFGKVRIGKDEIKTAGERYVPLCKDVHPRSVLDWIAAKNENMQIVLSSSVAAFDWIDPVEENRSPLLQHILLASRKSCHWEGNEYSQAGNHYYSYILTSAESNDNTGTRVAKQHNEPIKVIVNPDRSVKANLPEHMSFFNIQNENVIITTVKKAEDNDMLILRMYDAEGLNSAVRLNSWLATKKYYTTNIIEEYPEEITDITVPPFSIETFIIDLSE